MPTYKFIFGLGLRETYCNWGIVEFGEEFKVRIFGGGDMSKEIQYSDFRHISVERNGDVIYRKSFSMMADIEADSTRILDVIDRAMRELKRRVELAKEIYNEKPLTQNGNVRYIQNGQEVLCLCKADYTPTSEQVRKSFRDGEGFQQGDLVPEARLVPQSLIGVIVNGQFYNVHKDKEGRLYYQTLASQKR